MGPGGGAWGGPGSLDSSGEVRCVAVGGYGALRMFGGVGLWSGGIVRSGSDRGISIRPLRPYGTATSTQPAPAHTPGPVHSVHFVLAHYGQPAAQWRSGGRGATGDVCT